jgi:hypothetical protein
LSSSTPGNALGRGAHCRTSINSPPFVRAALLGAFAETPKDHDRATFGLIAATTVSPAICTEPDCDYTTEMEPDQDAGYCEACGKNSVASALILAGLI